MTLTASNIALKGTLRDATRPLALRSAKTMSRSYHVTKKKSLQAFAAGDMDPMFAASEKAWVKKGQSRNRATKKTLGTKVASNAAIVGAERKRTAEAREMIDRRKAAKSAR